MSQTLDTYRKLADEFGARVNAVADEAWDNQSPCEEWKARDVVVHVVGVGRHFVCLVNDTEEPAGDPGEVKGAWAALRADVEAALADPEVAAKIVEGPLGPMPFELLVGRLMCVDLVVHTWDLSRATGQDEHLDQDTVGHGFEGLKPLGDKLRSPGLFGPALEPPPGADLQTEFLSFLGRQV